MPKLWKETMAVRDVTLDTAAALVAKHGLLSVTMSQVARTTGIGRATLYKYFADVESIIFAWRDRQISRHLEHLAEVRDHARGPEAQLKAVLEAYALMMYERPRGTDLATLVHRGEHVAEAQGQLRGLIRGLLTSAAEAGDARDDVSPEELAVYCLHALEGATSLPSKAAVRRLVGLTLAGCAPTPGPSGPGIPATGRGDHSRRRR